MSVRDQNYSDHGAQQQATWTPDLAMELANRAVQAERERCARVCEAVAEALLRDARKLHKLEARAIQAEGEASILMVTAAKIRQG
jgi:hypothetical protein